MNEITNEEYEKQIAFLKQQLDELANKIPQKPKSKYRPTWPEAYALEKLPAPWTNGYGEIIDNGGRTDVRRRKEEISKAIRYIVWPDSCRTVPTKRGCKNVHKSVNEMTNAEYEIYIECFKRIIDALAEAKDKAGKLEEEQK